MVSREEAMGRAREYLAHCYELPRRYIWMVPEPTRIDAGWVFEYWYECVGEIPLDEQVGIAGAAAFIVGDDLSIRNLSSRDLR